ncbi:hypothetical protein Cni_G18446 [Canna indica]|uniref:AIG1-type G domain-containing protein n=1 Tax=Canna indica TaxID=4628 RepID=A0AAQ3KIW0_9LILI|nr:hypothetical protein Cni_G18446 [Canna indica]
MMENGAEAAREEHALAVAAEDGDVIAGVNGDSPESENRSKVLEEDEVFEEAKEPPPHLLSDSHDGLMSGVEEGATAELESVESTDLQVSNKDPEEQGIARFKNDDPTDAEVNGSEKFDGDEISCQNDGEAKKGEVVVPDKFDASIEVQNCDQDIGERVSVASKEMITTCCEFDCAIGEKEVKEESVSLKSNPVVVQSDIGDVIHEVTNGSSIIVNDREATIEEGSKESSGKKPENKELVKSDGSNNLLHDGFENEEPVQVTSLKCESDSGTESSEWKQLTKTESVESVAVSEELKELNTTKNGNGFSATNGGFATNKHSTMVKEAESSCSQTSNLHNDKAGIHENAKKLGKESVENLNCSSSERNEGTKCTSSMEMPSTSSPAKLRDPGLSSRPAGLGTSAPLLEPSARSFQQSRNNISAPSQVSQPTDEPTNDDEEENDEIREKLQMIRVKFLRLAHRLGQTPHNVVVAQVLYRLGLAEQLKRNSNRPGVFSFDRASVVAEQLEAAGQESLDFSCTIMVIGKTGVGKSATINSILDEAKLPIDAFQLGTKKVQEVVGTVQGIKVRFIDTPGLASSSFDQHRNEKVLRTVKRFINKTSPDIVLYFDRLDMQSRDYGDAPLLQTITNTFGTSIWFNAIVVLTHAASAPPDGPNGSPLSYDTFVNQRSHVVQQAIRQAAGDVRLMNPVTLVENHSACRMNRAGQRVLPNGQVWKPQLLLLSFASKILAEANMLLKLQDSPPGKPFGSRPRVPPLPFLLSSLLQSRPQLKLPEEQFGDDDNLDEDLDVTSDSDEGSDYDELPPFKPLTKSQLAKLSKTQKKAYFEELDYRERLFYKKQLKEEKRRHKLAKKMADMAKDMPDEHSNEHVGEESSSTASVPVPMPDYVLPNSFDSDNPTHRYRFLDSSNQWLIRPVLDSQGWDHDVGYEGLNVERVFVIKEKIPLSVTGQLTKDKKECALQMEMASSIKHSESKATSLCLDMQTVGKDVAYTLRGETRFRNFRRNNTAAGISVTILGDSTSAGLKFEDKLTISKRLRVLMSGGAMTGRGDVAYGGRLEATLRDKDYPIGQALSTIALSLVDWHGELALGCNIQSQFPLGRRNNLVAHANLSNKGTGQIAIRLNSSEHLQIALLALVPIVRNVKRMFGSSQSM